MTATMAMRSSGLGCLPLYGTPRSPERETYGPRVAEVAERLRKPLHWYQRHVVDVALEIDPETGLLAYPMVLLIGPRQIGKTEILLPLMTHRCVGFEFAGPQRVLYTAQTADAARLKWRDIHLERLKKAAGLRTKFRPRLTSNKEAFIWRNGSMWMPGSTTGRTGGTGDTLDLGVIDEAWAQEDTRTELSMLPTMDTRPWAQLWITSMIPGLARAPVGSWPYLRNKRMIGRARVEAGMRNGMAVFDWTALAGLDPGDPTTWLSGHPGIGYTTTLEKVRQRYDTMDLVDFGAEYLGWEPKESTPRWVLIRQETWRRLLDPYSRIDGQAALALVVDEDRDAGVICAAGYRADRNWHVEVVEPGFKIEAGKRGMDWMLPRTLEIVAERQPCTVVIDPANPASSFIVPLRNAGVDVLTPNSRDIAGACGRFYDATGDGLSYEEADGDQGVRVYHIGQPELDTSLGGAKRLDQGPGGAFTFVKRGSSSDLKALYGVTLAMHGREVKGDIDYDVLESVPETRRCPSCGRSLYPSNGLWLHAIDDTPEC